MQDTILREKNQITLPSEVVEAAGLKPGRDRIVFRFEGGEIRGRPVVRSMTREQVVRAIKSSRLKFPRSWEQMRKETREP
jgi:bifunctional DNA-binding transcriptional regulator/antitoxin component of YhaV-PrlF toxin-antitoxin module